MWMNYYKEVNFLPTNVFTDIKIQEIREASMKRTKVVFTTSTVGIDGTKSPFWNEIYCYDTDQLGKQLERMCRDLFFY